MAITISGERSSRKSKVVSTSKQVGSRDASGVAFHKHCQNTILSILGHGDTKDELEGFGDDIVAQFANNKTLIDDIKTLIRMIKDFKPSQETITVIFDSNYDDSPSSNKVTVIFDSNDEESSNKVTVIFDSNDEESPPEENINVTYNSNCIDVNYNSNDQEFPSQENINVSYNSNCIDVNYNSNDSVEGN